MNGQNICASMGNAVKERGRVAIALVSGEASPAEYLEAEADVRKWRRALERFRLESYVRFNGEQMPLADAEDLESAYETLEHLGFTNARVVETLRGVIEEGYKLPYDSFE